MTEQLLEAFESCGVTLSVEGDRLCFDAPVGVMTSERMELLRRHKTQLVALLTPESQPVWVGGLSDGLPMIGHCSVCGEPGPYLLPEVRKHYCEEHLGQAGRDYEIWEATR